MSTFTSFGFHPNIMKGLTDLGFETPSPIQAESIPFILQSTQDVIALAQTGTGKTAAFSLPILEQIDTTDTSLQAVIICPTRELALQISQSIKEFAKYQKGLSITPVYGGERIHIQIKAIKRGTHIIVGTPGRVHDLLRKHVLKLQDTRWVVLDEADEMLDMGFKEDLDAILEATPEEKQTLLFSATMSDRVRQIAKKYMHTPKEIRVAGKNIGAEHVSHEYYVVQPRDRFAALERILDYIPGVYGIVFCRTRTETQDIADKLKQANYVTEAIHGDVSQTMRTKIMDRFKKKKIHLLIATDVAARGIDVNDLTHVINYNLPDQTEAYTHRSGRTGRANKSGVSISILTPRETRYVKELERIIGKSFEKKQVPNGPEIYEKQVEQFLLEIEQSDISTLESQGDAHLLKMGEKLKRLTKDELVKHIIAHKFVHVMEAYAHARDLNTTEVYRDGGQGRRQSGRGGYQKGRKKYGEKRTYTRSASQTKKENSYTRKKKRSPLVGKRKNKR